MAVFLLTNDDGIHSEGLHILCNRISKLGQVYVAAPDREQSACGHAISLHRPLRMLERKIAGATEAWEVDGTPADCVKLAIEGALLPEKPDLVISGINRGSNLGTDVLYSGTVSAALEATLIGFPAMAVSLCDPDPSTEEFELAAEIAAEIAALILRNPLPKNTLLNINVPGVLPEELAGITVARLGRRQYSKVIERRVDPRGKIYYWIAGEPVLNSEKDTDIDAIIQNKVSVTPLQLDLTRSDIIPSVSKIIGEAGFFRFPFGHGHQTGSDGKDIQNAQKAHVPSLHVDDFPGGTP